MRTIGSTTASKSSLRPKTRVAIAAWVRSSPRPPSDSSTMKRRNSFERREASKSGLEKICSTWRRTTRTPGRRPCRAVGERSAAGREGGGGSSAEVAWFRTRAISIALRSGAALTGFTTYPYWLVCIALASLASSACAVT
jgi:hypothetical protein